MDHTMRNVVSNGLKKWMPNLLLTKKVQHTSSNSQDDWNAFIRDQEITIKQKNQHIFNLYWDRSLSYAVIFPHTPEGNHKLDPSIICNISFCSNKILRELNLLTIDTQSHDHEKADAQQKMIYSNLKMLLKEMAIYVSIKPTQNISRLDMILINRELLQLLENLCQYTGDEHLVELVRNCVKSFISIDWGAIYKEHYKELGSQWTGEQDAENSQAGSF